MGHFSEWSQWAVPPPLGGGVFRGGGRFVPETAEIGVSVSNKPAKLALQVYLHLHATAVCEANCCG